MSSSQTPVNEGLGGEGNTRWQTPPHEVRRHMYLVNHVDYFETTGHSLCTCRGQIRHAGIFLGYQKK